jgi:hypothetical protein
MGDLQSRIPEEPPHVVDGGLELAETREREQ